MTCPSGKLVFATPADAARAARLVSKRRGKGGDFHRGRLKHYHCRMCHAWHTGHDTPQQGKRA